MRSTPGEANQPRPLDPLARSLPAVAPNAQVMPRRRCRLRMTFKNVGRAIVLALCAALAGDERAVGQIGLVPLPRSLDGDDFRRVALPPVDATEPLSRLSFEHIDPVAVAHQTRAWLLSGRPDTEAKLRQQLLVQIGAQQSDRGAVPRVMLAADAFLREPRVASILGQHLSDDDPVAATMLGLLQESAMASDVRAQLAESARALATGRDELVGVEARLSAEALGYLGPRFMNSGLAVETTKVLDLLSTAQTTEKELLERALGLDVDQSLADIVASVNTPALQLAAQSLASGSLTRDALVSLLRATSLSLPNIITPSGRLPNRPDMSSPAVWADRIEAARMAAALVAGAIGVSNPQQAAAFGRATEAVLQAASAYSALKATPNASSVLAASNVLGASMLALSVLQSSSASQSSDQLILEQLRALSEQIRSLRAEMHARFDRVDATLGNILVTLNRGFTLVLTRLEAIDQGVSDANSALMDQQARLLRFESTVLEAIADLGRLMLDTNMAPCSSQFRPVGERLPAGEARACLSVAHLAATKYPYARAMAPGQVPRRADGQIDYQAAAIKLDSQGAISAAGLREALAAERLSGLFSLRRLPNVQAWQVAADQLLEIAVLSSETPGLRQVLRQAKEPGLQLQKFAKDIAEINAVSVAAGRYRQQVKNVDRVLASYVATAAKNWTNDNSAVIDRAVDQQYSRFLASSARQRITLCDSQMDKGVWGHLVWPEGLKPLPAFVMAEAAGGGTFGDPCYYPYWRKLQYRSAADGAGYYYGELEIHLFVPWNRAGTGGSTLGSELARPGVDPATLSSTSAVAEHFVWTVAGTSGGGRSGVVPLRPDQAGDKVVRDLTSHEAGRNERNSVGLNYDNQELADMWFKRSPLGPFGQPAPDIRNHRPSAHVMNTLANIESYVSLVASKWLTSVRSMAARAALRDLRENPGADLGREVAGLEYYRALAQGLTSVAYDGEMRGSDRLRREVFGSEGLAGRSRIEAQLDVMSRRQPMTLATRPETGQMTISDQGIAAVPAWPTLWRELGAEPSQRIAQGIQLLAGDGTAVRGVAERDASWFASLSRPAAAIQRLFAGRQPPEPGGMPTVERTLQRLTLFEATLGSEK